MRMTTLSKVFFVVAVFEEAFFVSLAAALQASAGFNVHSDVSAENSAAANGSALSGGSKRQSVVGCHRFRSVQLCIVVAVVFVLFMCTRKLRAAQSGKSRSLEGVVKGPTPPETSGRGKEQEIRDQAESPSPVTEPWPPDILWLAPPPVPDGPIGEAITRLLLLKDDFFAWEVKADDDPYPDVKFTRWMFAEMLTDEPDIPFAMDYPEEFVFLIKECREKILKLNNEGGDAVAVASEVIALFREKGEQIKRDHARLLKEHFIQYEEKLHLIFEKFRECARARAENMEAWLENTEPLREMTLELLHIRFCQHVYVDDIFFNSRRELAEDFGRGIKVHATMQSQSIKECRGNDQAIFYNALYESLWDLLDDFNSSANIKNNQAKAHIFELASALHWLTVDIREAVMFEKV